MAIIYRKGDLITAGYTGKRIIPHICNDIGAWGAGFVMALSARWKQPEERYRQWHEEGQYVVKVRNAPRKPDDTPDADNTPSGGYALPGFAPKPEKVIPFRLGMVQYVPVEDNTVVANMIGQHGLVSRQNPKPIKYAALIRCLDRVQVACRGIDAIEIHAPKFGAGLAQGNWSIIEELINELWIDNGLKVYIYEL